MVTTATTTIQPETLMSFGRTGSPMRDELIIKQQHELATLGMNSGDLNAEVVGIWTMPTDCTALIHGFLAAFSVIIVSELGDKTFIITAIMAMKNSRLPVFLASAFALLLMTILSVVMGVAVTVIPEVYTHYASIVLFICFGLKMLKEAYDLGDSSNEESEFEEVKRSLEDEENNNNNSEDKNENSQEISNSMKEKQEECKSSPVGLLNSTDDHKADQETNFVKKFVKTLHFAPLFLKVFTMIFVAEWGDRSQISTVILAAREDVVGVFVGSFVGHVLCTGLAVVGGRFVAEMISVRTSKFISVM